MSDTTKLLAMGFTITLMIDVSPALRALLMQLAPAPRPAMPDTVSRDAPGVAWKASQAVDLPGPAVRMDVSSLTSPAAEGIPPPAPFRKPPRKRRAKGGARPLKYETPERITWLMPAWRDQGVTEAEALLELNKMPGLTLTAKWQVKELRKRHGIERSPETRRRLQLAKFEHMLAANPRHAHRRAAVAPDPVTGIPSPPAPKPAARVMSADQVIARRNATPTKPYRATATEILHWGAEHGCTQDTLDLDAMNAHCRKLGSRPFELITPNRRAA